MQIRRCFLPMAIVLAAAVAGQSSGGGSDAPSQNGIIQASGFEVVDPEGRVRVALGHRKDGVTLIAMFDANGKAQLSLATRPDGTPIIKLDGNRLVMMPNCVALTGNDGTSVGMTLVPNSIAGISIMDRNKLTRIGMALEADGAASIVVSEENGSPVWRRTSKK